MRRLAATLAALGLISLAGAAPAAAAFGLNGLQVDFTPRPGTAPMQAGSHPLQMDVSLALNTVEERGGGTYVDGALRDLEVEQPLGFAGSPVAVPRCETIDFLTRTEGGSGCPDSSAVGVTSGSVASYGNVASYEPTPVYLLEPSPGSAGKLGFWVIAVGSRVPVTVDLGVSESSPHNVVARLRNIPGTLEVLSSELTLWGNPADPVHDPERGSCRELAGADSCSANVPVRPLITLPRSCPDELRTVFRATPWWTGDPLAPTPGGPTFEDVAKSPGTHSCEKLGFGPEISSRPNSSDASSATGLAFTLRVEDEGIGSPGGLADADIREATVILPEGVTINPSQAEGLATCSIGDLARERADSPFGAGCPAASKIGTVEVESPLLPDEVLRGSLFVATPHANRADNSLIAFYIVIKDRELGILVTQAAKVTPDPRTGQLVTRTENMPQLPFSEFRLRFREGGRSPLITPPRCGTFQTTATFTSWAGHTHSSRSPFQITRGPGGGPCPPGGTPPFAPGFAAGSLNNFAGAHTPFHLRLTRRDGDQDIVRFDATLPPGLVAKLAGVPWCPEAGIARARGREDDSDGGRRERSDPSCPLASQIGSVQGGAGVGSQLTYVPGKVYLAGPVGGAPLSVVGIVPAVAGPFDVGTIVVRQALDLDPVTGQAKVVSAASDELPHILAGIPLKVRDIQVSVDRPDFTLNPTNCTPMAVLAGIWGGGTDVFSAADDFPVLRQARFQAAGCASLGFEPKLAIKLKGGVRRGAHPALRAHVRPRPGDANFSRAVVTLPTSAFLDQAHIRTICTRVQFAAGPGHGALCPEGARYGFARAWSPLLDGPVTGPVYLRSSDNNLPDLVAALTGPPSARVQVELSARIDSVKGGIRSTFAGIPDVPVSRFILDMQGGKKGLIVNSRHLCHKPGRNRARANLRGQNGKPHVLRPVLRNKRCKKQRRARHKAKRSAHHSKAGIRRLKTVR